MLNYILFMIVKSLFNSFISSIKARKQNLVPTYPLKVYWPCLWKMIFFFLLWKQNKVAINFSMIGLHSCSKHPFSYKKNTPIYGRKKTWVKQRFFQRKKKKTGSCQGPLSLDEVGSLNQSDISVG